VLIHDEGKPGVDRVQTIQPDGRADVFCVTEPVTNSIVVNGFVVANCGEKPLLPWDACTLGHVNLEAHLVERNGRMELDHDRLRETVQVGVRFLDDVIDAADHPLPEINEMTRRTRQIGLGVMGLARVLIAHRLPYDSEAALDFTTRLMARIERWAWECSTALAMTRGVYPAWPGSRHEAEDRKVRNSFVLTVAPTGSVSMIAHTSPGIEPEFSLLWFKRVLDGKQIPYICEPFERVAKAEGWWTDELLDAIAAHHGSCRGVAGVPEPWQQVFATAHDIAPEWHVRMQATVQKHVDSAVSKTINLPASAAVEDVARAYRLAWELGCKGITVYRDGSRQDQVLNVGPVAGNGAARKQPAPPAASPGAKGATDAAVKPSATRPIVLPPVVEAKRVRVESPDGAIYVHIGYADGRPVEVFAATPEDAKHEEVYEAFARIFSIALQWGTPLEKLLKQLEGANRKYGSVSTIPAAILRAFRMLEAESMPAIECPKCRGPVALQSGCWTCTVCGWSKCD
jgi:ribonucleoside-diphosphate reductase alpha chain